LCRDGGSFYDLAVRKNFKTAMAEKQDAAFGARPLYPLQVPIGCTETLKVFEPAAKSGFVWWFNRLWNTRRLQVAKSKGMMARFHLNVGSGPLTPTAIVWPLWSARVG
jgi:hypothetical protein